MNIRIARKVVRGNLSKRFSKRMHKLHPPYIDHRGHLICPSWHMYYRIAKAWVIVKRKERKYQEKFKHL